MTTANAIELPSYLHLPPGAVCAGGCGQFALNEGQPDLQQHEHYVCALCTEKGVTSTPADVGTTAGRAIGAMYFAAKELLIELSEAIEQITDPEQPSADTHAVAVNTANTLAAPVAGDPFGPRPLLTAEHGDGLMHLAAELRDQIAHLTALTGRDPDGQGKPDQLRARRSAKRLVRW